MSYESENALNNKENWRREDKTDANKRKRKIDTNKNSERNLII